MVSRLDRLFILLDSGSNESVRLAAAKQLGQVQRIQPSDLDYLLCRIKEYSGKSIWETRVAAGHATRCVLEQLQPWPPLVEHPDDGTTKCKKDIANKIIKSNVNTEQILGNFDLEKTISCCPKLLSLNVIDTDDINSESMVASTSRGKGRARKESTSRGSNRKNDKEVLMRQRKLINKELGIAMVDSLNLGVKSTDIVTNDDLQTSFNDSGEMSPATKKTSSSVQQDTRSILQKSLSNYERVLTKLSQEKCISSSSAEDSSKDDEKSPAQSDCNEWPLMSLTSQYTDDLFHPSWEIRHGAAIALREIVKIQGKFAGKRLDLNTSSNDTMNQLWLVDMALKALSVLALDKFGDFLFDQVVAPVRENAAQLLGCCVAFMSEANAFLTINLTLKMLNSPNWETRHGGMLGLKYSLSIVDKSFSKRILVECFDPIFKCLGDSNDDVSAEAAASLVPVKDLVIDIIPDKAPKLIKFLWEHLADLDELTTSTSNIVLLLASLITSSSSHLEPEELKKSIPKLWSLLGHSSTSVRVSVLKALITLIKPQKLPCSAWMPEDLMTTALKLIFQRSILENMEEVRPYIEQVWLLLLTFDDINDDKEIEHRSQIERFNLLKYTSQYLNYWLCLVMQPSNVPIDRASSMWLNIGPDGLKTDQKPDGEVYIGSYTFNADTINQQKEQVTKCRLLGTRLLGALYANLVSSFGESVESQHARETSKYLSDMFIHYIKTKSSNQRIVSGWAIETWACNQVKLVNDFEKLESVRPKNLLEQLNLALQEISLLYDELAPIFTRLQQEAREFVAMTSSAEIKLNLPTLPEKRAIYNLNQIQSLCELDLETELKNIYSKRTRTSSIVQTEHDITKNQLFISLSAKQVNLRKSSKSTNASQKSLSTSVLSSLVCAYLSWKSLPSQLDLITKPLLDSIEIEEETSLQEKSINYLVILFDTLSETSDKHKDFLSGILERLLNNLCCKDKSSIYWPGDEIALQSASETDRIDYDIHRIIQLDNLNVKDKQYHTIPRRQSSVNSTFSLKRSHSTASSSDIESNYTDSPDEHGRLNDENFDIRLRGANIALNRLTTHFGDELPNKLPSLWGSIHTDILNAEKQNINETTENLNEIRLLKGLRLLEVVGASLTEKLRNSLKGVFAKLISLLISSNPLIRHRSSRCLGVIMKLMFVDMIDLVKKSIIPMLEAEDTLPRCGSIESIALIIENLNLDLVPRINMFVVHVLRRMSDQNDQVRLMATHCFGKLLSLMPLNLERSSTKPEPCCILKTDLTNVDQDDKHFIEQLLDPKKLDNFSIPFEMEAELRSYQQDGLNWLAFMNRYNLHGILCDEMGLGKTLMTICMVSSDHFLSSTKKEKANSGFPPSLIVCPSTLTEHWLYEVEKFLSVEIRAILNPIIYAGALNDRMALRRQISRVPNNKQEGSSALELRADGKEQVANLVVASYDVVRNDIEFFKTINWNYCVLDEGHIIKNGKTKLSRAIRLLNAKHRLILSGTPIQNNVTELWSLFDYLMPGFLGSERQFNVRYAKPILQSKEPKCTARELEAGALAMESLHRQVLPFILRRLKEDVLDDLPPKIIQDYYCELSSLQQKLYEDFTRSKLCKDVTKKSIDELSAPGVPTAEEHDQKMGSSSKSHVFQALQYLKNVCNHPKLVLTEKHSQYHEIKKILDSEKSSLDDIIHSAKLNALKQLLIDCGIGATNSSGEEQQQQIDLDIQSVVNQHRALVFCQIRSMVNIIENDLLKKHLPDITYLKLDGSIPLNERHSIVSRFNNDPSIDILLLTTQIGGLGLNLTGADTVIFVEHDWNPTKDLQAMDRAHRIGQRKVVNVYRLITKGTLEEKIMGLQKFKTMVSNTVINQDNSGLGTMKVDQLFDLFDEKSTGGRLGDETTKSKQSFMDLLPELWDQQHYEMEYDLSNFVSSLKN